MSKGAMKTQGITGPLAEVDHILVDEADKIEDLLSYHRNQVVCPVYTSVDIRRNDCKAAVVDTNAFPAGFNNLAKRSHDQASGAIGNYISKTYPGAEDLLILAEGHTRNKWYFENLHALASLFESAGFNITLGSLNEELFPQATVETATGRKITIHGVLREGDALIGGAVVPDVVILNNDLSNGAPDILDGLDQPITPPPAMGWHRRSKSNHFQIVNELSKQLGSYVDFDPWLIAAYMERVDGVDFRGREGFDRLAEATDRVVANVADKYSEYNVEGTPKAFIKADAGTYGMGVMTAQSGEDLIKKLNSKMRERMDRGKGRTKTTSVIVQEAIPSHMRAGDDASVAEPVIYMVCGKVVGGFHRVHSKKREDESLNTPGSTFHPFLTQGDGEPGPDETQLDDVSAHVYQVLGEIASIATGYECSHARSTLPNYP